MKNTASGMRRCAKPKKREKRPSMMRPYIGASGIRRGKRGRSPEKLLHIYQLALDGVITAEQYEEITGESYYPLINS